MMSKKGPYNPWSEGDEDYLEGIDTKEFTQKAKQLLKEKKSVTDSKSEAHPGFPPGSMEAKILRQNPELTPEKLEEFLKSC